MNTKIYFKLCIINLCISIFMVSIFTSCRHSSVKPTHPPDIATDPALSIARRMSAFSELRQYESGLAYFDSLLALTDNADVPGYNRSELLVASAEMLYQLDKEEEVLYRLDEAMSLPPPKDAQAELFISITAGIMYQQLDITGTKAEPTLRRAIAARSQSVTDPTNMYSRAVVTLAYLSMHRGQYQECIDLCHQTIVVATETGEIDAAVDATSLLSTLYLHLGRPDEAIRYNTQGLAYAAEAGLMGNPVGDLWLLRINVLWSVGQSDSIVYCLDEAARQYELDDNPHGRVRVELARLYQLSQHPESLSQAIEGFPVLETEVPHYLHVLYYTYYGHALTLNGQYARAIPVLRQAVKVMKRQPNLKGEVNVSRMLMKCYLETGRTADARHLLPLYETLTDSLASQSKIQELAAANIFHETELKVQENRVLTAELELHRTEHRNSLVVATALLLLIATGALWQTARRKAVKREYELAQERLVHQRRQLRQIIQSRRELNAYNKDLFNKLTKIQQSNENNCQLDTVMQSLTPKILSATEEKNFRRHFSGLYPSALSRLRGVCPTVTRTEEIYAMLCLLNLSDDERADTLGIARRSVSKIRYRLRIRIGLPEGSDVDEYLRKIMKE